MPLISVIIPLYNKEAIIEQSVKSVLSQSFKDFELIIVDDGSTDNGVAIIERIQDERIKIIKRENGGPSAARNTGAKNAKGDWIVFLDADDELVLNALENFVKLANNYPHIDMFDCGRCIQKRCERNMISHSESGFVKNNFKAWFYREIAPGAGPTLFKKDFVLKYPYREDIRRYEDAELLFRMFKTAKIFSTNELVEIHNVDYAEASNVRKNVTDDYVGHLSFKGLGLWEKMCMYKLYLMERDNYPDKMRQLYPTLHYRYDLLLLYKVLNWFG